MSNGVLTNTCHHEGITIRLGTRSALGTNDTATATNILNHKSLLQDLGKLLSRNTRH